MLTDEMLLAAAPRAKGYKLFDSGGLHVFVTEKGAKSWRWKYRFDGREKRLTFGLYPAVTMSTARRLRDIARLCLKAKQDPAERPDLFYDPDTVLDPRAMPVAPGEPDRVYFVQAESGSIKIGVASDVLARVAQLQRDSAEPLRLLGSMRGSYSAERMLHRLFAEDRLHGEWFAPSRRLRDYAADNIDTVGA